MSFATDSIDADDELDLGELFRDIKVPEPNMYIADEEKAVTLISSLIKNEAISSTYVIKKIESYINELFALFTDVPLENELELYEQFLDLCARLSERQKIRKIQDKAVVSFGGKFSAGKSKFINSISGIGDLLPVAQAPTTSIPTYIIKSNCNELHANSVYGYSTELTSESMNALTHEFYNVYSIGFSAFIDSIIAESKSFSLPDEIALLDTPGYTKFDEKNDSKMTISDRQKAFDQLRVSDYLIWLVDIENGGLTQDDISFIETLRIKTPILIVFTKADLKPESQITEIISGAQKTIERTTIDCFGVTAYSSNKNIEYGGNRLIPQFINYTISGSVRSNDILGEFRRLEAKMRKSIEKSINKSRSTARGLFKYITQSKKIIEIRSLSALWGKSNQEGYRLNNSLKQYDDLVTHINSEILKYIGQSD